MNLRVFVSAILLAAAAFVPFSIRVAHAEEVTFTEAPQHSAIDVIRIKRVLNLTPEQQAYWPPVEAALRRLAHGQQQPKNSQDDGMFRRISNRVSSAALDAAAIARIGVAVRPLVKVLDIRQKMDAVSLVQEMGLGPVLAALS